MKVQVIVEQASDGKFWCYTEQDIENIGLSAMGDSVSAMRKPSRTPKKMARLSR